MYFRLEIDGKVVDLYKDESIQLQRQVKDYAKIESVYTDYSQSFNVPATDVNNLIFQSFFDENVLLGSWNQNKALPAKIFVYGLPVFNGVIEMQQVQFDSGLPTDYTIVFYGQGKSLMNIFDEQTLADIDWSYYNHTISDADVISSWSGGLFGGDIVWDVKDYGSGYVWSQYSLQNNIAKINGINYDDLRPSIKLKKLIEHLFTVNNLTLSGTLFARAEFNNLYVTPMASAGSLITEADKNYGNFVAETVSPTALVPSVSTNATWLQLPVGSSVISGNGSGAYSTSTYQYTAPINGDYRVMINLGVSGSPPTGLLGVKVVVNNKMYWFKQLSEIQWNDYGIFYADLKRVQKGAVIKLIYLATSAMNVNGQWGVVWSPWNVNPAVVMQKTMPDVKCNDLIDSVLKMYNAVLIPKSDTEYELHNLMDWYALGTNIEYTQYIDFKKHTHKKVPIPRQITMKHQEIDTMGNNFFKKLYGRVFGDVSFRPQIDFASEELTIDSQFTVNVPTFINEVNATGYQIANTDLEIMCLFNDDAKGVQEKLCLFYFQGMSTLRQYKWYFGSSLQTQMPISSSFSGYTTNSYSVAFGLEGNTEGNMPKNTMYFQFWNEYVSRLYSTKSRVIVFDAYIPVGEWLTMKLNDTYVVSGNYYKMQNIKYDMLTQRATIEFMTYPNIGKITVTSTTGKKPVFSFPISTDAGLTFIDGQGIAQELGNAIYDGTDYVTDIYPVMNNNALNGVEFLSIRDNLMQVIALNKLVESLNAPIAHMFFPAPAVFPFDARGYEGNQGYYDSALGYGQCVVVEDGQYRFRSTFVFNNSGNHVLEFMIMVNGMATEAFSRVSGNHIHTVNLQGSCSIGAGSLVQVMVGTGDGGNHLIDVQQASWSIERVL